MISGRLWTLGIVAWLLWGLVSFPHAAGIRESGAGIQQQEDPAYDSKTVHTYTGVVSAITSHTGRRGTPRLRATLRTDDGTVEIHVGPTSFLNAKDMRLAVGDRLVVIGSRVRQPAGDLVLVRQLAKGAQVLVLRDEQGRGLWGEEYK